MFDLKLYFTEKNKQINAALDEILKEDSSWIAEAMKYSLMAGGKRIRPVLCMAAAEAVRGNPKDVLPAACAIEMIHTYSLIHDDLPAMDDDELRRGKPTCHVAYDEATAILAGDALLTLAFQILSSVRAEGHSRQWLHIAGIIAHAAGYRGMIEGQMRDIASEGTLPDLNALEDMHALKTGALIQASVKSGAILGGGSRTQIEHLEVYAKNTGLAFQVADDILNVEGNQEIMGKAVGTDKTRKKSTYPSVMGIEKSKAFAGNLINNALQSLDIFGTESDPLRAVAMYIIERKR